MMARVTLGEWAGKTAKELDQMVRAIQIETFTQCINLTRVDTGRMRGNWQTNVGSPITKEIGRKSKTGNDAPIREAVRKVTSGDVVYLTNNVPYCEVYERKDGMMRRALANVERNVRRAAKQSK